LVVVAVPVLPQWNHWLTEVTVWLPVIVPGVPVIVLLVVRTGPEETPIEAVVDTEGAVSTGPSVAEYVIADPATLVPVIPVRKYFPVWDCKTV
jgi:hypothetical protein